MSGISPIGSKPAAASTTYKSFGDDTLLAAGIRQIDCTFKHDTFGLTNAELKIITDKAHWYELMPKRVTQGDVTGNGGGGVAPFPSWIGTEAPIKFLGLTEANVTFKGSDYVEIKANYIGTMDGVKTTVKYSTKNKVSNSPIETHPDFRNKIGGTPHKGVVTEGGAKRSGPINGARFDPKTGEFLGFDAQSVQAITKSFVGIKNYYQPFPIIEGEFYVDSQNIQLDPHSLLTSVGKASTSGTFNGFKLATSTLATQFAGSQVIDGKSFKRSWMLLNVDYDLIGNLYHIKFELELSGPRGWNPEIYTVLD